MKKLPDAISFARALRKNPTKAEKFFWQRVRRKQILGLRIQRQFIITHSKFDDFESHFIVDFYCHAAKLIIELDGEIHKNQGEYDEVRTSVLHEMGYQVIRFSNQQVIYSWDKTEAELTSAIQDRLPLINLRK